MIALFDVCFAGNLVFAFSTPTYTVSEAEMSVEVGINIVGGGTLSAPVTVQCSRTISGNGIAFAVNG